MALSTRWLAGVAALVAVLVVASIALAGIAGDEEALPADTPGGVVQRYLQAVLDRDADTALSYLSTAARERCDETFVREQIRAPWRSDFRAVLQETRERGATTEVWVSITEGDGGPFGSSGWTHREVFVLEQVDGAWRIVEAAFPFGYCPSPVPPAGAKEREPTDGDG